jgi:hypothetical protein
MSASAGMRTQPSSSTWRIRFALVAVLAVAAMAVVAAMGIAAMGIATLAEVLLRSQ